DAQQPLMRLSQPVLPTFALARASGRRRVVWVAAETIAIRRQRIARAEAEVAMIYREQQMVDGAGVARPLQTIEILFASDHDDRNVGAALDAVQLVDQPGCLALGDCGGEHDETGTVLTAERQRG